LTRAFILAAALLGAVLLCGCTDPSSEPPEPVAATPVNPQTAGRIAVRVRYTGPVPEPKAINMASTPGCAQLHPEPVFERSLEVDDGGLKNAVVWIEEGLEGWVFAPPAEPAVLDQKGCIYEPRVAAAMVGQPVQFLNSDPEAHNVHGRPQVVRSWNFMMSRQGSERTLYFDKPEIGIRIGCDIHPWMMAFLSIVPNPYFGVSGAGGEVEFAGVPPGDYGLAVWHETLGTQKQRVTVAPKGSAEVEISYAPR
jgi:plastocyanin